MKKIIIIGLLISLIGAVVLPSFHTQNIQDTKEITLNNNSNLYGYWSFDEGTGIISHDISVNENNADIFDASWDNDGIVNGALDFDGYDDYLSIPGSLNFGNSDFSLSVWIKTGHSSIDDMQIAEKMNRVGSAPYKGFYLRITAHNFIEAGISDGNSDFEVFGNSNLTNNNWHHLVAVFDRLGFLSIYVDGNFQGSVDITSIGNIDVSNPLYIGKQDNSDNKFKGMIDEVRIYDKTLSGEEIQHLYTNPSNLKKSLVIGKINNLNTDAGSLITFKAEKLLVISFSPFQINKYFDNEHFIISEDYSGIISFDSIFSIVNMDR